MPRTVHRTPRHLDDPLKIIGFTLPQWLVLALGLTFATDTVRPLAELPQRVWYGLFTPATRVPGPPRLGPDHLVLLDEALRGEVDDA